MKNINALVISGCGINCEKEMALGLKMAGANPTITHVEALLLGKIDLDPYHLITFPGGFSFGDELGAAKALANRLIYSKIRGKENLKQLLKNFVDKGKGILGICNGFQLLIKLGLLPNPEFNDSAPQLSLTYNDSHRFESRWIHHTVNPSRCIFTTGLDSLYLPVRHGEGKLVANDMNQIHSLFADNQVVLQYSTPEGTPTQAYPHNPNGSIQSIAGLCDHTGRVFGMMAHPEAALFFTNHPHYHRMKEKAQRSNQEIPTHGPGFPLFKNAIDHLRGTLGTQAP